MRAWIDIDNEPQARYLLPVARQLERAGHALLVTARAGGGTLAILDAEAVPFDAIGARVGTGRTEKLRELVLRTRMLTKWLDRQGAPPDFVVTGSRAATLAAHRRRIPSFVILDYEFADVLFYALSGSQIIHPSVINPARFRRRGVPARHLISFEGLKEDITFSDLDPWSVPPHPFPVSNGAARILVRPPAEASHYYRSSSRDLTIELLRYLGRCGATVVFAPRSEQQVAYLENVNWVNEPIVLDRPVDPISLLKGVDAVVSAGGTMAREAAYLGVPAYSTFTGAAGAVDQFLSTIGRLTILKSSADFSQLNLNRTTAISPLREHSPVTRQLVDTILDRASSRPSAPE